MKTALLTLALCLFASTARADAVDDEIATIRARKVSSDIQADALYKRARIFLGDGDLTTAERFLNASVETNPSCHYCYLVLGNMTRDKKDYAGAERLYLLSLEKKPDYQHGHFALASLYLWKLNKPEKAREYVTKLLELNPKYPGASDLASHIKP